MRVQVVTVLISRAGYRFYFLVLLRPGGAVFRFFLGRGGGSRISGGAESAEELDEAADVSSFLGRFLPLG